MGGLYHICGVDVVVVGHVGVVVVLQGHHEGDEGVRWDLEGLQKVSLLRREVGEESRVGHEKPMLTGHSDMSIASAAACAAQSAMPQTTDKTSTSP